MTWWWFLLWAWLAMGVAVLAERMIHRHLVSHYREVAWELFGCLVVIVCWPSAYVGPWLDKRRYERKRQRRRTR